MKRIALSILLPCLPCPAIRAAEPLPILVERMLETQRQIPATVPFDASARDQILARPDPGTFFLRYAYGLKRHAAKLLDAPQSERLDAVLAHREPLQARWHAERNTVRCKFNEVLWLHAAASAADAPKLRANLETWMRLRMEWTQQEHIAQYRFARDVWILLTAAQQQKLIKGEWKTFAKQDTGHTRGDATAKIITRALGKPDDPVAFTAAIAPWTQQRIPLHTAVSAAESTERRLVFAMDLNNESMAHAASEAATRAYGALYLAEADAIRSIVQAAYHPPGPRCEKAALTAWGEAKERFQAHALELIEIIATSAPTVRTIPAQGTALGSRVCCD